MGKGSSTSKTNVTKRPQRLSDSEAAGGGTAGSGGGAGGRSSTQNACLVSFTAIIEIASSAPALTVGQVVMFVQGGNVALNVISGGVVVGSFSGDEQSVIEDCMSQGYIYKGTVKSIDGDSATCSIKGYGVQNASADNTRH